MAVLVQFFSASSIERIQTDDTQSKLELSTMGTNQNHLEKWTRKWFLILNQGLGLARVYLGVLGETNSGPL